MTDFDSLADELSIPVNYVEGLYSGLTRDKTPFQAPDHLLSPEFKAGFYDGLISLGDLTKMSDDNAAVRKAKIAALASVAAKKARGADYIDPATSNKIYSSEETEFLKAVMEFKKKTNKRHLTETDRFQVLISLGYVKMGLMA